MSTELSTAMIVPGVVVEVRNAFGDWIEAVATSGIEGTHRTGREGTRKIHDFPIVWVRFTTKGRPMAWPAEDVRLLAVEAPDEHSDDS